MQVADKWLDLERRRYFEIIQAVLNDRIRIIHNHQPDLPE